MNVDRLDRIVLYTLKISGTVGLSELNRLFNRSRLPSALERLVNAGKVRCAFDGADYQYRATR
jgi:hypothetical protein